MIQQRLTALREKMHSKKIDAFFISNIPTITYLTTFSGFETEDRNAFLLVTADKQYIFTHSIYTEAAKKYVPNFRLLPLGGGQPISKSLQLLIKKHAIQIIGFESKDLRAIEYLSLTKKVGKKFFIPADDITDTLRILKTTKEISAIRTACALGDKAFDYLLTQIKSGITEKELALKYEIFIKEHGASLSFETIVAFGENGTHPHHVPTDKKLEKNSFIVLDFGVKLHDYCSDMTRTVFFGKANEQQKNMYEAVLEAQTKAIAYLKDTKHPTGEAVDKVARDYMMSQGFPDIPHSLGHGIGLMVHEAPSLSPYATEKLTEGMVFSLEPGIYLPGIGGVRIEDLAAIENNQISLLTTAPKNLIELS